MANQTQHAYKNTLSGSVGAGIGSLFTPGGKKYYILEHKVTSKYHKAGESQEIIVDNIELGRDPRCQVRFDESFVTVSRHHAAIVREGDMWKLIQISKTNTTFLNGYPVQKEWYLQNGDEIQLSINGPKLGFIIPTGKKATVGSIGLTRRLSLFRQQALRPYKYAIAGLSACLVLAVAGLGVSNYFLKQDFQKQGDQLAMMVKDNESNKALADSLARELVENNKKIKGNEKIIAKLQKDTEKAWKEVAKAQARIKQISSATASKELAQCYPYIYFVQVFTFLDGKPSNIYSAGTGFLLRDGKFVTAQHVVNHWESVSSQYEQNLNLYAHNGGNLSFKLKAYSRSGDRFEVDYSPKDNPFKWGKYDLNTEIVTMDNGANYIMKYSTQLDYRDYAYMQTNKKGGLDFDADLSKKMPAKTHLDILGFPQQVGAENLRDITPIYSESSVAREGLDLDGCILLSNSEADHGNSGGPVLVYTNGKYKVIGILSKNRALGDAESQRKDCVVPISAIYK